MSLPPLRRQVVVPAAPDAAFEVFTGRIGAWWPVARHSVYGADSDAAFRDGRLVETGPDGSEAVWGTVLAWEPGRLLSLTWHPGRDAAEASRVEVGFAPITDALTMVTVTHSGWEVHADAYAARDEYKNGWPAVLGGYAALVPAAAQQTQTVWIVLQHSAAPGVDRPAEHPEFGGHAEFLGRLRERDVLVAAGPFPGTGEGMTVLRLPSAEVAALVAEAADGDTAVAKGVLEVRARPWVVVTKGSSLA